ncbi:MAG: MFS transporter [Verrucomicrobia bacterium]|nr:MFS transporter [Verrucomicrobiota bacterium]
MFKLTEQNRKWWVLIAMTSCISMIFIDITVLPVTLPTLERTLHMTPIGLQWIINAYTLALTVFVMAAGRFGDRYGHRRIFCWGLLLFSIGSTLCGASYSEWWFISSRTIQGIGAAMLVPTSSALLFNCFPAHQRGRALGLYVSIGSVFLSLGPVVGGLFTQYLSWRYVFWINIPIAIIGLILTLWVVPKREGHRCPFDLLGFLTSSLGITSIVIGIMEAKEWGWLSPLTIGLVGFGIVLIFLLLLIDRQVHDPYIDLSLFKDRNFTGAISTVFITQFFLMVTVFWAVYFQTVLEFSPAKAGLISLISNLPVIFAAPLGGHLLDRHGPRLPISIGFTLIIFGLFWFLHNLDSRNVGIILTAVVPFGCGVPLIFTPSFTTALGEVAPQKRGLASGTATMLRQLGATLGLAIMGSLFLTIENGQFSQDLQRHTSTATINPNQFQGLLAKTPQAIAALQKLPTQAQGYVNQIAISSNLKGYWAITTFALVSAMIGLCVALWLIKKKTRPDIEM